MFASFLFHLFFAAIPLTGVTGEDLHARAFFDANNVKVGDPLILTIDFIGEADFTTLHPPALSKHIARTDWKLDDASAKTDTYQDARRLTYRVRPMREGVLYFPALNFTYLDSTNGTQRVTSNLIPVHAKKSSGVVVAGMAEHDEIALPEPPPLITTFETSDPDLDFAWRKACAAPSTNAFAAFDFPAAKLNEARLAILAGDWQHALKIYSRLEWQIGQTPEIERGIIAALARRTSNPLVELPVWRQVGRPILRYTWLGRLVIVSAALLGLALLYLILRCALRALAILAFVSLLPLASQAQGMDPFKEMDELMKRQEQMMQKMQQQAFGRGGFSFNFGGEDETTPINLTATITPTKQTPQVGESFDLIFALEMPKNASIAGGIQLELKENIPSFHLAKHTDEMTNGTTANPSNVVRRFSLSVRFDAPFKGPIHFTLNAPIRTRIERKMGASSFSSIQTRPLRVKAAPLNLNILPLPTENQPADFSGIIAKKFQLAETLDLTRVETNDVVSIYYHLTTDGYVPSSWTPPAVAYEQSRSRENGQIIWRRYFVADGAQATPSFEVCWYDPEKKEYHRQTFGSTPLAYHAPEP